MEIAYIFFTICFGGVLSSYSTDISTPERIVGGNPTTIHSYPFMVQVELWSQITDIWSQNCAGSILTSRFIMSAAQCFTGWNLDIPYRRIRAGATYRNIGGTVSYVDKAVNHPLYGSNGLEADISVVRLMTSLMYSSTISQATIVTPNSRIPDNIRVVLAGWGRISAGGPNSNVLRDVTVYTVNNRLCAERYANLLVPINVTENMICAGIFNVGGRDACHGDSGGPMYLGNVVIGIISGGYDCANGMYPGISTAVASYTDWVIDTVLNWPHESKE